MRNKTLTSSMAGALLFGGTLGASAQAATVIDNFATVFGGAGTITTQSGAGILGTREVNNPSFGLLLSFDNPGMNWNGSAYNYQTVEYSDFGSLDFTNVALTMTGSGSATGDAFLAVTIFDGNLRQGVWNVAFGSSITMSTSSFSLVSDPAFNVADIKSILLQTGYSGSSAGTVNYTMTNFSYSAVPAPGAIALLGVAGLAGGRRRRA